jgi:hypothetical protein
MHSIKNIDRLTDLAAIDVYNTTHDTINKYEIMKEHATEEYTNESFYQESVLAGVLIGAGVLGVAISAFFIIKKIIDSKDSADSSVKSSDGKMVAAQVDLTDPKSTEKYLSDLGDRLKKLTETKSIKVTKSINKTEFESAEKQINDWSEKLQEIIDNKHEAAAIEKIIDDITISSVDASKIFVDKEMDASVADLAEVLGLRSISSFASLLNTLKKKIDDVEKMVNNKKDKEAENAVQISQDHLTKLKNQNNAAAKLIATLKAKSKETLSETDKAVLGAINAETEAEKKDEEDKSTAGTGSDTPQNANPQAQSSETATPAAQNSGQNIPPSSTPENIDFQASGFNGGQSAEPVSQPAPAANPQASATGSEPPTPVSGNQSAEPNLGTNFLNAVNRHEQQQQTENLTQQFGSNPARENSNAEKWINAANANNADAEAKEQEMNPVPQQPTPSPQPQSQKSETETPSEQPNVQTSNALNDENILNEFLKKWPTMTKEKAIATLKRLEENPDTVLDGAIIKNIRDYYKNYRSNRSESLNLVIDRTYSAYMNMINDAKLNLTLRDPKIPEDVLDAMNKYAASKGDKLTEDDLDNLIDAGIDHDTGVLGETSNDNNADKSKSENKNKEVSKPTASDFENFKNPQTEVLSEPEIVDIDELTTDLKNGKSEADILKSLVDKGYSQGDASRYLSMAKEDLAEESSEPQSKVAIADEDVKNLITFSNIPENFANDISKTITDDINNNTPFNVQHIKDMATNLSKENGEDFAVNAKQIQKVFRDMAVACKPQTDAVKQYIDAIDKTDINSLNPQEASTPVDNKPQLSPEEMTDQIVNNINQIPTSAINNANTLVSSSYDDATKQQIAKEVISKLQSSGQTTAAGVFASSLKTSLGYTDTDLNSSELPLYGSEKGTYEPLTGKNQAMNMISNNPVDNGMIETVARLRNEGLDDDQIRQKLLAANWKPELIEGMLQKVNNMEVQNNPNPTSIPNQTGVIDVDAAAENATPQNAQNNESIQYNISKALNDYKSTPFAQRHVNGLSAYGLENEVNNIITRAQSLRNTGIDPAKSITMREAFNNLWKQTGGGFGMPSKDKKKALEAAKEYTKLRMTEAGVGDFFQEMFALDSEYHKLIQECDIAIIREEKLKLIQEQQTDPEE